MYYPYGYFNSPIVLVLLGLMVLGFIAQSGVRRTFSRYDQMPASSGVPAEEMVRDALYRHGVNVSVSQAPGFLTDHFNPKTGDLALSEAVYGKSSVAALAVAAHETGHAIQHEEGYMPIRARNAILPVAQLGSQAAPFIALLGILLGNYDILIASAILFGAVLLFQLVTLPVEFNASSRGLALLAEGGYLERDEQDGARRVLRAAAMTYVVAALAALFSLLRILMLASGRRRR